MRCKLQYPICHFVIQSSAFLTCFVFYFVFFFNEYKRNAWGCAFKSALLGKRTDKPNPKPLNWYIVFLLVIHNAALIKSMDFAHCNNLHQACNERAGAEETITAMTCFVPSQMAIDAVKERKEERKSLLLFMTEQVQAALRTEQAGEPAHSRHHIT